MFWDIYFIVFTAFAFFGVYCLWINIKKWINNSKFPVSLIIMENNNSEIHLQKIKYIQENIPNNYTVMYPFDNCKDDEQLQILQKYIETIFNDSKK